MRPLRQHSVGDGKAADATGGGDDEGPSAEEWEREGGVRRSDVSCVQDEHDLPCHPHALRHAVPRERAGGDEH